ncbi:MAG: hypothetical protein ABIU58_10515 [Ramlibacter sp.]
MSPSDRTPHGDEILHEAPERVFSNPKPDRARTSEEPVSPQEPDIAHRPALPDHPQQMAVDIEDEEADPVIDTGPGIDEGVKSLKKQRG